MVGRSRRIGWHPLWRSWVSLTFDATGQSPALPDSWLDSPIDERGHTLYISNQLKYKGIKLGSTIATQYCMRLSYPLLQHAAHSKQQIKRLKRLTRGDQRGPGNEQKV